MRDVARIIGYASVGSRHGSRRAGGRAPKPDVASVARAHQIDLSYLQQQGNERPLPLIVE